jgi:hypothetical protein
VLAGSWWFLVDREGLGIIFFPMCKTLWFRLYGIFSKSKSHWFWVRVQSFRLLVPGPMGYSFYKALGFRVQCGPSSSSNSSPIKWTMFINCFPIQKWELVLGYVNSCTWAMFQYSHLQSCWTLNSNYISLQLPHFSNVIFSFFGTNPRTKTTKVLSTWSKQDEKKTWNQHHLFIYATEAQI